VALLEKFVAPDYVEHSEGFRGVEPFQQCTVIAGPVRRREETLIADLDLRQVTVQRRHLDPAGHYHRPDIFRLHVDTAPRPVITQTVIGGTDEHRANGEPASSNP